MMKTILIAATAMTLAAPAFAQQPAQPATPATPATRDSQPAQPATPSASADFVKIDSDKNGALTIAEVKLHDVTFTQADFDRYDADKNKALSKTEFEKWAMAKKADKASSPGE